MKTVGAGGRERKSCYRSDWSAAKVMQPGFWVAYPRTDLPEGQ
jgi:hypothetical protein